MWISECRNTRHPWARIEWENKFHSESKKMWDANTAKSEVSSKSGLPAQVPLTSSSPSLAHSPFLGSTPTYLKAYFLLKHSSLFKYLTTNRELFCGLEHRASLQWHKRHAWMKGALIREGPSLRNINKHHLEINYLHYEVITCAQWLNLIRHNSSSHLRHVIIKCMYVPCSQPNS